MQLLALSLNYRNAPLALRERITFSDDQALAALAHLRRSLPQLAESAIVSTCSRSEIYACVDDPASAAAALIGWLARDNAALRRELQAHVRVLEHEAAARHVFRVASGLDSMVLGEPQILGQMKRAARTAHTAGTLGSLLHQLFQRAFAAAKEVRTRTHIGRGSVSHAAAAVALARGLFGDLSGSRVLLIGAGAMIESVAPHFAAEKPREIVIANRTPERGERIARELSGRANLDTCSLGDLPERLQHFDIVVSCTGSPEPLVTCAMVRRSQCARMDMPLLIVDVGVPRDVEPQAASLPGVSLYSVDDLGKLAQARMSVRAEALAQAAGIVDAHVRTLMEWMALRPCVPLLRRLNEQAERLRATELERARRIVAHGHPVEQALCSLAAGLSNKLLHAPRTLLHGSTAPELAQRLLNDWVGALERGVRL
jgi:glutamyl-tRNA reductase